MNTHYIPRMYLKGWETRVNNQERQICVYERNKEPAYKSTKVVSSKQDYYSSETETWLDKELENRTDPILGKIIGKSVLSEEERSKLAQFIFVMWQRVPFHKDLLFKEINRMTVQHVLAEFRVMFENFGIKFDDIVKELTGPDRSRTTYSELVRRDKFGHSNQIANMKWVYLTASPGKEFVTSDNPFVYNGKTGIGHPLEGYFLFPINNKIILQATNFAVPEIDYQVCDEAKTQNINRRIIKNSYLQIYASAKNDELKKSVDELIATELPKPRISNNK
ncbi:MAG: DUF4238 domain-containing protein [Pyrinomonadaceae bacterium]